MKPKQMTTLPVTVSLSRSPLPRRSFSEGGSLLTVLSLALACFALLPAPKAFGVSPPPDGGYANENTAEGADALFKLTTGSDNTANGFFALNNNTTGTDNTGNGFQALLNNTTGSNNTATGLNALNRNTTGGDNTANGNTALFFNTTGGDNSANGFQALFSNTTGFDNTANGANALQTNTSGGNNTANGLEALFSNTTGSSNIALGVAAGFNLTTGSNNIDIGNQGVAAEGNTIRIGSEGTQSATFIAGSNGATIASGVVVHVNPSGQLGTWSSSRRFKEKIKPMDKSSEAILALKPVPFRYKHELDPEGIPQFGLVAEDVEKVNPDLVARDAKGQINTVRYEAVNAMLLNEFLKEHKKVEEQQKEIAALAAQLKQQAALIREVGARLEVNEAASRLEPRVSGSEIAQMRSQEEGFRFQPEPDCTQPVNNQP